MSIFSKYLAEVKKPVEANKLVLVFDIGSSSVGGAVFMSQASGVPKILYVVREQIRIDASVNVANLLKATMDSLKKVAGMICMKGFGHPSDVFCVMSAPWYTSQTRVISFQQDTPFAFTNKLADSLIQKEIDLFEEEYRKKYAIDTNKIKVIEMKTLGTSLNGYATQKPIGQSARSLELTLFVSITEESLMHDIGSVINRHFHIEKIRFVTSIMAYFMVARDMFVNQDSFLLVNIGGEVTDIAMVKKDILRESMSFPLGRNYIVRGLASELSVGTDEAKSYISLQKEGHMSDNLAQRIEPIMEKLKREWLSKFQEALSTLTTDISIPATIFITVDQDLVEFFSHTIKTEEFNQYALTESKFRVIFLGTEALHGIALFADGVIRDPFLIVESIYINQFLR